MKLILDNVEHKTKEIGIGLVDKSLSRNKIICELVAMPRLSWKIPMLSDKLCSWNAF
jgi:hypothetical protein